MKRELESNQSIKIKLYPQEDNPQENNAKEIKPYVNKNNEGIKLFFIEKLGFFIILISGLMPFVHSFVEHKALDNKIFGFLSLHQFLYSLGIHLCAFLLVIGVLMATAVATKPSRYKIIQNYLRYSLISPFVSGIFYLSWIFIPDVNYNLLAYIFLALFISTISLYIFFRVLKYINTLKLISEHKENVLNDGISYLKTRLNKGK